MRILAASLILLLAAVVHAEPGLTGKWRGATVSGTELVLDLTATATAVTGTLTRAGEAIPISDGKVAKDTFTFKASLNDQTESFTGKLAGDDLSVWMDRQGPEMAARFKRETK